MHGLALSGQLPLRALATVDLLAGHTVVEELCPHSDPGVL